MQKHWIGKCNLMLKKKHGVGRQLRRFTFPHSNKMMEAYNCSVVNDYIKVAIFVEMAISEVEKYMVASFFQEKSIKLAIVHST